MTLNDLLRKAREVINQLPTGDVLLYTEDGEPITDAFFEIEKDEDGFVSVTFSTTTLGRYDD